MGTLTSAMSDRSRDWTAEEVSLVEGVATRLRIGVEAAHLQQREHRITMQLQAGIGGELAQVFSTDKSFSYLIGGDLAGKGHAAAGQIATLTNMARYAVFRGRTLAGTITNLNAGLVGQNLLMGFATFFIARFDAQTRILTYVNAGQDAELIMRASTRAVELMPTTGSVLGISGGAGYTEGTVLLERDDVLMLFTDGLSEAGPSRTALLTNDGVADMLRGQVGSTDP